MQLQQTNKKVDGSNYKILIVDDSKLLLELLEKWLSQCGFSVVAVRSGLEAIDRFNNELFDLVLTDIYMPGINGNLLAQYIHAVSKAVPVIAVTAVPHSADKYFDLVISKPYELMALLNSLQYVLGKYPTNPGGLHSVKRNLLNQLQEA